MLRMIACEARSGDLLPFFMPIFPQFLLALVGSDLFAFPLSSAGHWRLLKLWFGRIF